MYVAMLCVDGLDSSSSDTWHSSAVAIVYSFCVWCSDSTWYVLM